MKTIVRIFLLCGLLGAISCGSRQTSSPRPVTREFPMAEVPRMMTDPGESLSWLCRHFWDRFTATDSLYVCDSVTVNGVPLPEVERQMGVFATLTEQISLLEGQKAVEAFYERLEAFQLTYPQSNLLPETVALASRYFYDPNSPVRSEDLYLPLARRLAASSLIDGQFRERYAWEAGMCALNPVGAPAADFVFVDSAGRRRTLYGVKAARTLLIFGHPDCKACRELMEAMEEAPGIRAQIADGGLKVVDVYIDEDIAQWKAHLPEYPAQWINGYDPAFAIRGEHLYHVRAIPSLYLLDSKKTVLLKDATPERVLQALL